MRPTFVRPATPGDALRVAQRLRKADREEALAASGMDPTLILPAYVREGREVYAAGVDQLSYDPIILFGIDQVIGEPNAAVVWMLSTDDLYRYPVEFVIASKRIWNDFHKRYSILTNFVDARNERHIKWLRWLGCVFPRRVERFGAGGLPFIEFVSYRPCA